MSKRVTVNVPDDVAERLAREGNVSAFVTDALRARMRVEASRRLMAEAGFHLTDEGLSAARRRLREGRGRMTPAVLAEGRQLLEQLRAER